MVRTYLPSVCPQMPSPANPIVVAASASAALPHSATRFSWALGLLTNWVSLYLFIFMESLTASYIIPFPAASGAIKGRGGSAAEAWAVGGGTFNASCQGEFHLNFCINYCIICLSNHRPLTIPSLICPFSIVFWSIWWRQWWLTTIGGGAAVMIVQLEVSLLLSLFSGYHHPPPLTLSLPYFIPSLFSPERFCGHSGDCRFTLS